MNSKFGVCEYDFHLDTKPRDLIVYDNYDKAIREYQKRIQEIQKIEGFDYIPKNIWLVYIDNKNGKDYIVQFEQLSWKTICKLIDC